MLGPIYIGPYILLLPLVPGAYMRIFGAELSTKQSGYPQICEGYPQIRGGGIPEQYVNISTIEGYLYLEGGRGGLYGSIPSLSKAASLSRLWCGIDLAYTGIASL